MSKSVKLKNDVYIDESALHFQNERTSTIARKNVYENLSFDYIGDVFGSGLYAVNSNGNAPNNSDTWYYLFQIRQDNWCYQEAIQWWDTPITKYVRRKVAGTWENWTSI